MEIAKLRFAVFMTIISLMCSETASYGAKRIRKEFKRIRKEVRTLKKGMSLTRNDITELFEKTNQLNISVVEGCGLFIPCNKTSCLPLTNHDGRQDMVEVKSNKVSVKYNSLIKAFVTEKKINRELQSRLQSMNESIEETIADIYRDIRNNMTLMNTERERVANERDRELQSRLRLTENNISAYEKAANERDRYLQDQLKSVRESIEDKIADIYRDLRSKMTLMNTASKKVDNEKDRELQNQLRSMRESIEDSIADIYRDIRNNMTIFMTTISDRIDEHLLKTESKSVMPEITTVPITNTDCTTVPKSGVYTLYLQLIMSPVTVYCDQDTDGGGWIVFMRRQDGSVNFDRSWSEYKHGFGSPDGEFWAGNEFLYRLTKEKPLQLRIDMEDFDGNTAFAVYEEFQVGAEEDKYRLHVSGYSGTAGDSLIDTDDVDNNHAGMQFSTFDSDNDKYWGNCAKRWKGGWWYNSCFAAKLNAPYSQDKKSQDPEGILWYSWKGYFESLKRVEMKIRDPSDFFQYWHVIT